PDWLRRAAEGGPERPALIQGPEVWTFAELDRRATALARQLASSGVHVGARVALLAANSLQYAACVHALGRLGAVLVPLNIRLTVDELIWQLEDVRAGQLIADERYAEVAIAVGERLPNLARFSLGEIGRSSQLPAHADQAEAPERHYSPDISPPNRVAALQSRDHHPAIDPASALQSRDPQPSTPASTLQSRAAPLRDEIDLDALQAILYTSGTTGQPKGALITYGMQWWSAMGSALN